MDFKTRSAESSSINNKAKEMCFYRGSYIYHALLKQQTYFTGGGDVCRNYTELNFLKTAIQFTACL